jgi:hypothetical protein
MSTETILQFTPTCGAAMSGVKTLLWADLETYPFPERNLVIEPISRSGKSP